MNGVGAPLIVRVPIKEVATKRKSSTMTRENIEILNTTLKPTERGGMMTESREGRVTTPTFLLRRMTISTTNSK